MSDRRYQRSRLSSVLSVIKDACVYPMIGLDVSGGVSDLNAAFVEFLGYENREQLLEHPLQSWIQTDALQRDQQRLTDDAEGFDHDAEVRIFVHRDGRRLEVATLAWIEHDETGRARVLWIVVPPCEESGHKGDDLRVVLDREVVERRRAEEKLEMAVLEIMEHDLARTQFVSNVSHELKTPLVSMKYAIGNMLRGVIGQLPDSALVYLGMLSEDCQRLTRTVNDILDLSTMEHSALTLNENVFPLHRFVTHAVESLRIQAEMHALRLNIVGDEKTGFVSADSQKLERVVLNLVRNAIKYTPQGGMIEVVTRSDIVGGRAGALIEVRDTGVGIPEEHVHRVTERYFRVGEHVSGSGLGLAISKEIVQLHGGGLELESPPPGYEQGTLARVVLPRVDAPHVWLLCETGSQAELAQAITQMGYSVEQSDLHKIQIDIEREQAANVIVIELLPRGMRDMELLALLKTDSRTADCRFIAVGAGTTVDPAKSEILDGYRVVCLDQPWSSDDLFDCMA